MIWQIIKVRHGAGGFGYGTLEGTMTVFDGKSACAKQGMSNGKGGNENLHSCKKRFSFVQRERFAFLHKDERKYMNGVC